MKKNNSWYTIILSILMVWFMLVLTSGVFALVMWENKDTKAMEYYLKAFAWAQWANELAMLKAKQNNYSYSKEISNSLADNESILLSSDSLDKSNFNKNKDILISYKIDATSTWIINKSVDRWEFEIIPLFTTNPYKKTKDITVTWLNSDVVWNILSNSGWLSWVWNFSSWSIWNLKLESSYESKSVWDYLIENENNYLILHNASSWTINYSLSSPTDDITKDITYIISSAEVWWYKQNIKTEIQTSKYLNLLKYSVFSE